MNYAVWHKSCTKLLLLIGMMARVVVINWSYPLKGVIPLAFSNALP